MIFLHSSFRTCSTWLWTKFREQERFLSYYEIFNPVLEDVTVEKANISDYREWDSRHPPTPPYFQEFIPLIRPAGGVDLFERDMEYQRFIPKNGINGDISEPEIRYLASLISHAERLGKTPVLSDTRSLGRVAGIKRSFGGTHVLIYRNPFHQWCSYSELYIKQNFGFIRSIADTIINNKHDAFLSRIQKTFDIKENEIFTNKTMLAFIILHMYLYAQTANQFDILIDATTLATDISYRIAIESELGSRIGGAFDLSDAQLSLGANLSVLGPRKDVEAVLEPWVAQIVAQAPSDFGRQLAAKAYADFLDEYELHFFYVLPIVKSWSPIHRAWNIGREIRDDEIARLESECASMRDSLSRRITNPLR